MKRRGVRKFKLYVRGKLLTGPNPENHTPPQIDANKSVSAKPEKDSIDFTREYNQYKSTAPTEDEILSDQFYENDSLGG